MAKIRESNPKHSSGAYERLLNNKDLANIFTKAQSTVITNGTELEKIITSKSTKIDNLDDFINQVNSGNQGIGVYLCTKKVINQSKYRNTKQPDFIVFEIKPNGARNCTIVELKDGDSFDTKKSQSEKQSLIAFKNDLASNIPFVVRFCICSFNQSDKEQIYLGFKKNFEMNEILTGQEFCDMLGISYDDIQLMRTKDAKDNFEYVVSEMTKIVFKGIREHISEAEFYDLESDNEE